MHVSNKFRKQVEEVIYDASMPKSTYYSVLETVTLNTTGVNSYLCRVWGNTDGSGSGNSLCLWPTINQLGALLPTDTSLNYDRGHFGKLIINITFA